MSTTLPPATVAHAAAMSAGRSRVRAKSLAVPSGSTPSTGRTPRGRSATAPAAAPTVPSPPPTTTSRCPAATASLTTCASVEGSATACVAPRSTPASASPSRTWSKSAAPLRDAVLTTRAAGPAGRRDGGWCGWGEAMPPRLGSPHETSLRARCRSPAGRGGLGETGSCAPIPHARLRPTAPLTALAAALVLLAAGLVAGGPASASPARASAPASTRAAPAPRSPSCSWW